MSHKTFKAALWAATREQKADQVYMRFGHVRRHDHHRTEEYIRRSATKDSKVSTDALSSLAWVSATKYSESQAADLYGGFLKAAVWPSGEFDDVEPSYLMTIWRQIRRGNGCAIPLGIHAMPSDDVLTGEPWFPCPTCRRIQAPQSP